MSSKTVLFVIAGFWLLTTMKGHHFYRGDGNCRPGANNNKPAYGVNHAI